jgi:cardiolipin synthase A/B
VESFVETWNECKDVEPLDAGDFAVPAGRAAPGGGVPFWLFNQDLLAGRAETTEEMFDGLFASAEESICLIQPYTFVNPHILSRMREMHDRGVEVNVILSDQARAPRFRYASHFGIRDMLRAGAKVWIYESDVTPLHYKCALVDDRLSYVGSSNLNLRSYRLSRELNAVFRDPASAAEIRRVVDSVLAGSQPVGEDEARRYRSPRHFSWWFVMQFAG